MIIKAQYCEHCLSLDRFTLARFKIVCAGNLAVYTCGDHTGANAILDPDNDFIENLANGDIESLPSLGDMVMLNPHIFGEVVVLDEEAKE